jgi:hypothetical protein
MTEIEDFLSRGFSLEEVAIMHDMTRLELEMCLDQSLSEEQYG